jgi:hypothetical protein
MRSALRLRGLAVLLPFLGCSAFGLDSDLSSVDRATLEHFRGLFHCPVSGMTLGDAFSQRLGQNDCRVHGDGSPYVKYFAFHVGSGDVDATDHAPVRITMESSEVDSYLVLYSYSGTPLAVSDDFAYPDLDARIDVDLVEGDYAIAVRTASPGQTGEYRLSLERVASN